MYRVFRFGAQKIKIIVTTRSKKVASIVCPFSPHHLKQLTNEECWLLFSKHAFKNIKSRKYQHLEVIGREISLKCKGLPLAAKTLGGLLRSKQDPREWNKVLESDIWDLPEDESNILGCTDAAPRPAHPCPTRRDAATSEGCRRLRDRAVSCPVAIPE